jgi:hypothetical protein
MDRCSSDGSAAQRACLIARACETPQVARRLLFTASNPQGDLMNKQLFLALALTLAACSTAPPVGDDDGDDDTVMTGADPVEYDALYGKLAEAYCERVFSCCAADERTLIGIIPYTEDRPDIPDAGACTTYMTDYLHSQGRIAAIASAVAAGTVQYDPQRAGDCLAGYDEISCDVFGHDISGARDMQVCSPFVADAADGEGCEWDEQCESDYCASPDAGGDLICRAKPGATEFCPVAVCAEGLFCDSFGDATCKPLLGDGVDCTFNEDCQSGYCNYDVGTGKTGICSIEESWVCDGS